MKDGMKDDVRRFSPTCHFERKREIFFICAETVYACERKREACLSRALGATVLHSAEKGNMGNDPYTFLFIPLREPTSALSGHLLPQEGGSLQDASDSKSHSL